MYLPRDGIHKSRPSYGGTKVPLTALFPFARVIGSFPLGHNFNSAHNFNSLNASPP